MMIIRWRSSTGPVDELRIEKCRLLGPKVIMITIISQIKEETQKKLKKGQQKQMEHSNKNMLNKSKGDRCILIMRFETSADLMLARFN